ncbi:crotonase/enoyl-CoA hydratase family protein [soil metagenome]
MSLVLVEHPSPVVTLVTLNRPERRNALTIELMTQLVDAINTATTDESQRVLILRGAGPVFCAGMDLNETQDLTRAHDSSEMVARTLLAISQTRLITVAQVHGAAVAGGAGIMSACDFVVAAEGTKFGYPEARRGLVAAQVMTFLRRQLRERDVRELLFTAELIDAARAKEIGLVSRVVAADQLEIEAQKLTSQILQGAPGALMHAKRLLEQLWSTSVKEDIETAIGLHMQARESDEAKEGVAAFLEKRKPNWAD